MILVVHEDVKTEDICIVIYYDVLYHGNASRVRLKRTLQMMTSGSGSGSG